MNTDPLVQEVPDSHSIETMLEQLNQHFRSNAVPLKQRPLLALGELSTKLGRSIDFSSPEATKVFEWFSENSKPNAHSIGSLFTGAYYFDAAFWPVRIPLTFGTVKLDPLDSIDGMPASTKKALLEDVEAYNHYQAHWLNCANYAYGLDALSASSAFNSRAKLFLKNASAELSGVMLQLIVDKPIAKAIISAGLACEIFLKIPLVQQGWTDDDLKNKVRHDIVKAAKEAYSMTNENDFLLIAEKATVYPQIKDRYDGIERDASEVWIAARLAQMTAASIIRLYAGTVIPPPPARPPTSRSSSPP